MGLGDELLEDAQYRAIKGIAENRPSCMRRAISSAYYAVFHLLVEEFISYWPFLDQRARLARMFDHRKMREAQFTPIDRKSPAQVETGLLDIKKAFGQLQADRHKADYDLSWIIVKTDVNNAITLAQNTFVKWRSLRNEEVASNYLLAMFGANR